MKFMTKLTTLTTATILAASMAVAEDQTIEMLNKRDDGEKMVFSQDVAFIDIGDSITWVPTSKGHNVEFVFGPEGWELPKKSAMSKEYTLTFDEPGIYFYVCTPHEPMGMMAAVVVGEDKSNLDAAKDYKVRGKKLEEKKKLLMNVIDGE